MSSKSLVKLIKETNLGKYKIKWYMLKGYSQALKRTNKSINKKYLFQ